MNDEFNQEGENVEKLKYPKQIFLILITELCERFCYYGMRGILVMYLTKEVGYTDASSVTVFHAFSALCYFCPLFGAIVSDAKLGKYKTIVIFSLLYITGLLILTLSAIKPTKLPQGAFSCIGLAFIALGTGGIKPCVSAFGGDQFVLPQQQKDFDSFFNLFYLSINIGSAVSTLVTPSLKENIHCFGENTCYSLGFGTPAILMIIALITFITGTSMYKILLPKVNVLLLWIKCVWYAVKERFKSKTKVDHWLDRSEPKYGKKLVADVKETFWVMLIFLPLLLFWALFDQMGSTWTLQANQMDGLTGSVTILPGNMVTFNAALIIVLLPMFTYGVYPLCSKINLLTTPLKRITCGGFVGALSFLCAALVSLVGIEPGLPVFPTEEQCHIRLYNPLNCTANIDAEPFIYNKSIPSMGYEKIEVQNLKKTKLVDYQVNSCIGTFKGNNFNITERTSLGYFISTLGLIRFEDDISKDIKGRPKVRTLVASPSKNLSLTYWKEDRKAEDSISLRSDNYSYFYLTFEKDKPYKLSVLNGNTFHEEFTFYRGAYYTVLVNLHENKIENVKVHEITQRSSFHILWQIPQYFLITVGEVLLSPTALEFAYTQAPVSMKAFMTSAWLVTTGLGNILVIFTENLMSSYVRQSTEFFIYSVLMTVDMLIFLLIAMKYKYVYYIGDKEEDYQQH